MQQNINEHMKWLISFDLIKKYRMFIRLLLVYCAFFLIQTDRRTLMEMCQIYPYMYYLGAISYTDFSCNPCKPF